MDETAPTNELIERLTARLTPAGRRALESMAPERAASLDDAVALMDALPEEDRALVAQISQLKAAAYDHSARQNMKEAEQFRYAADAIEQAQAIQEAAGEPVDESMTLGEALAILERHGERPDVHPDPDPLGIDRARSVPRAPTVWHIEGHLAGEYPDPLMAAAADEDGDHVISNLDLRVNDVMPFVPVRAEIYRHADKETVLRLLEKMRAHVEVYWEAR